MAKTVGIVMTETVVAGLIVDHQIAGGLRRYPEAAPGTVEAGHESDSLIELPADALAELICEQIAVLAPAGSGVETVGVAMPGIVRGGIVEDSPNLPQLKGAHIAEAIAGGLAARKLDYPVQV
jgi:glucokinase